MDWVDIRPKMFKGMRVNYCGSDDPKYWYTLTEKKFDCDNAINDCGEVGSIYEETYKERCFLPGEPGCPRDPSSKYWEWQVGDECLGLSIIDNCWVKYLVVNINKNTLRLEARFHPSGKYSVWAVEERGLRRFWPCLRIPVTTGEAIINPINYNHICPKCGSPAFLGFLNIECSNKECL